jgi:uncharacterized protein
MIFPDVNILIYATDRDSPFNRLCSKELAAAFEGEGVGFSWHALIGFVRLTTHLGIVARLLLGAGRAGLLVPDAHLAALAIEHQATLLSFDRDFESFPGVRFKYLG